MTDTFATRLQWLRELAQLKARELDRLISKAEGTTSMAESGDRKAVYTSTASLYAEAFGVSLDWLVRGLGEEPRAEDVKAAVAVARLRIVPPHTASDFAVPAPSDGEAA